MQALRISRVAFLILLIGVMSAELSAQYAVARAPRWQGQELRTSTRSSASNTDTIRITPLTQAELAQASASTSEQHFGGALIAQAVETRINPREQGVWLADGVGGYVWRCTIKSQGAHSLGVILSEYRMPEDGALFVHGKDGKRKGAFTSENNNASGRLALAPVAGDELTLEFELPLGMSPQSSTPFVITQVSRGLRDWALEDIKRIGGNQNEPFYNYRRQSLEDLQCAPNTLAFPERQRESRSVICFIVTSPNGRSAISSGALINNAREDGTAYVLTSAHCINGLYAYADNRTAIDYTLSTAVFFFGFASPSPLANIRGAEELTLSGAKLVAYEPEADMALIKITGLPTDGKIPASYNPYFAGWNAGDRPESPYFGIHHPLGSTKRYSEVNESTGISIRDYPITMAQGIFKDFEAKHWFIPSWSVGTTATGSSGSPLFDREGRIIGALTGGSSSCHIPTKDYYWAVSRVWRNANDASRSLAPYLDPDNQGLSSLRGYDPHSTLPVQRLSTLYGQEERASLVAHQATENQSGVGQSIRLSRAARPLGGFIVFAGNEELQKAFPNLILELRSLEEGQVGEVKWSTTISSAQYRRYNASNSGFEFGRRTVAFDSIELFVPSPTDQLLPEGKYMLGLRTADGKALNLPLLGQKRSTLGIRTEAWTHSTEGNSSKWIPASHRANYWIDLLVEAPQLEASAVGQEHQQQYHCYFYNGQLYALNPGTAPAELFIYNLSGELIQRESLAQGESIIHLEQLIPHTTYIAYIKGDRGRKGTKFIYEP